ncbi:hypothetical protein LUZ62_065103 [Rhynchospora pubera]|uniref:RING-type E3 ubiquitin transferase n=1 Tax=Rhynchospora pubera TaxID=906938 RepID=A0AAV8EMS1_9POAL|nr:hypothetical protein LUZ62_065103 [Rhynchospora pubera]
MSGNNSFPQAPQPPPPTSPLPPTSTVVPFNPMNNTNGTSTTINFNHYYNNQGSSSNGGATTYTRFFFVAITCLCLVASFVLFLHLYLRYVRRRHLQHHRRQTANIFRLTTFAHERSNSPRAGLDRAAISSIPSFQYQKEARSQNGTVSMSGAEECAVCLSLLEEGEVARMLPACRHVFHVACIDKWLTSSASCPVCRADVQPQMQVQGQSRSQSRSLSRSQSAVGEAADAPVQDQSSAKEEAQAGGSVSTRLSSSFRRMLSGNRSSRRVQDDAMVEDLERGNGANSND